MRTTHGGEIGKIYTSASMWMILIKPLFTDFDDLDKSIVNRHFAGFSILGKGLFSLDKCFTLPH